MKQTKYMKQWFSEIGQQAAQSDSPGEKKNKPDEPYDCPSLLTGEFPGHGREGEPKTEPGGLSELKRPGWKGRKAKATIILREESLREDSCTKRELWRWYKITFESSTGYSSGYTCEKTTQH